MSTTKDKNIAKALRSLADEIDPPVNKVGKPPKTETSEVAQEIHKAALTSLQTKPKGDMNLSLNSLKKSKAEDDDP